MPIACIESPYPQLEPGWPEKSSVFVRNGHISKYIIYSAVTVLSVCVVKVITALP